LRAGHAGAAAGQCAALRKFERHDARVPIVGQGHARQSEKIPDHSVEAVLSFRKQLVVNADDFGFTPDVNEGIVEAHRDGILTSTTLMANGAAFEDAVSRAAACPTLDIGCHLVLVGGRSLLPPCRPLPASVPELLAAIVSRQIRVYDEMSAQVRKILAAGIAPT